MTTADLSSTAVPFVGELEGKPGCFICAGHNGHGEFLSYCVNPGWLLTHDVYHVGMARIMTCARGVATLLSGGTWGDTGLPECFQPASDRMSKDESRVRAEWTEV